jgi:hypothetical protein
MSRCIRCITHLFTLALVAQCITHSARAAEAAGAFKLAYRATPATVYDVQVIRNHAEAAGPKKSEPELNETRQAVRREVTANPDGTLSINDTVIGDESYSSYRFHQRDSTTAPEAPPRRGALISTRGERLGGSDGGELDAPLAPVFPDAAIAPGHRWKTEVEFPPSSGERVQVQHEFLEVQTIHGHPCAVVVSEIEAKEGAVRGFKYGCSGHGRIGISLKDGSLIESQTFVNLIAKARVAGEDQVMGVHDQLLRNITLRKDGPAATPSPAR